jgi:hypothetical protein
VTPLSEPVASPPLVDEVVELLKKPSTETSTCFVALLLDCGAVVRRLVVPEFGVPNGRKLWYGCGGWWKSPAPAFNVVRRASSRRPSDGDARRGAPIFDVARVVGADARRTFTVRTGADSSIA